MPFTCTNAQKPYFQTLLRFRLTKDPFQLNRVSQTEEGFALETLETPTFQPSYNKEEDAHTILTDFTKIISNCLSKSPTLALGLKLRPFPMSLCKQRNSLLDTHMTTREAAYKTN